MTVMLTTTATVPVVPVLKTESVKKLSNSSWFSCQTPIIWRNVAIMFGLHLIALWVSIRTIQGAISPYTVGYFWLYAFWNAFGILAGAHRLWSHRAYKARLPLRILLMCMQTGALQNSLYDWCRNHRVHHRYSETDADPHNSKRGFFFAHMGWLLCRKHPAVALYGKNVQMNDLLNDPVVRFQSRHYYKLVFIFWLLLPVSISVYYLNESLLTSLAVNCWRYVISLHNTWLVNSLAHWSGTRPYNSNIEPRENKIVTYFSLGEGYHNYHHTFPWDYSASELGWCDNYNLATAFIDFFAWFGLAYDRKVPNKAMVARRMEHFGDGSGSSGNRGGGGGPSLAFITHHTPGEQQQQQRQKQHYRHRHVLSTAVGAIIDNLVGILTLSSAVWLLFVCRIMYMTLINNNNNNN